MILELFLGIFVIIAVIVVVVTCMKERSAVLKFIAHQSDKEQMVPTCQTL